MTGRFFGGLQFPQTVHSQGPKIALSWNLCQINWEPKPLKLTAEQNEEIAADGYNLLKVIPMVQNIGND